MTYREENRDLFTVSDDYYLAHCISADFKFGAGIAVEFNRRFDTKKSLIKKFTSFIGYWDNFPGMRGICILDKKVYNLITKRNYWDKPTLSTMENALKAMKAMVDGNPDVKKIAMPKIGCGLDKLHWEDVSALIKETFMDTNVEILVCYQ